MSRSFLLAFFMSLIFHSLLAWVEMDLFKRPTYSKRPRKTLTINVANLRPVKKRPVVESPSTFVKEPAAIKTAAKMAGLKPKDKPKREVKKIQQPEKKLIDRKKLPQKEETPSRPEPVNQPTPKKEALPQKNHRLAKNAPAPPADPPKREAMPKEAPEKEISDPYTSPPITYALPNYKENRPPPYPLLARRRGHQGTVLLEVLVTKDGVVGAVRLVRSSGSEILDKTAIKGVKKWVFYPGKKGDEVVEMWVKIPITFQLR